MRFNNNSRQRSAELDRRIEKLAQQFIGQIVTDSRRSNTVGLKIPFLVCDLTPRFNALGFYDLVKPSTGSPQRGSEIDTGILTSTSGRPFQCMGKGVWLVCVGVDVEIGEIIGDPLPNVTRTRAHVYLDYLPNMDIVWASGSNVSCWDATIMSNTSGLGTTTATLTGWFMITTAGNDPHFPRPNARADWTPRVLLEWRRIFPGGSGSTSATRTLSNASALIVKIDTWIDQARVFLPGTP